MKLLDQTYFREQELQDQVDRYREALERIERVWGLVARKAEVYGLAGGSTVPGVRCKILGLCVGDLETLDKTIRAACGSAAEDGGRQ